MAYFVWPPTSRLNYGELIEPRPLPDREWHALDGKAFRLSQLRGKWLLLQVDSGGCGKDCKRKLLYMRQARLAQGAGAERIERIWLLSDSVSPDPLLLRDYPGLRVLRGTEETRLPELPAAHSPADYIYVVDPLGNLMLRFPSNPDARRMMKDIDRLLRASRIG
jgi:hypothetical protein